eukprot:GHVP01030845.1.p1 GENE.GHVP01030845.1~~GHVP01030845.1.p1  ORF type:complete len:190 (+),score=43.16 GHVP01030845.1:16-585(+)
MFTCALLEDTFALPAEALGVNDEELLQDHIEDRYLNRVIPNVGLCVSFFSIDEIVSTRIPQGEGSSHFKVLFRLAVFRPFYGEILECVVGKSTKEGMDVKLGFFDDIRVPAISMKEPGKFDEQDKIWTWEYQDTVGRYEQGAAIRVQVDKVVFNDPEKATPASPSDLVQPMVVLANVIKDGLGLRMWWY